MQKQTPRIERLVPFIIAVASSLLVATALPSSGRLLADELDDRRQRLEEMTAEEKAALLRKKERFDRLSQAERQRMRDLHASIESRQDSERLRTVLERYNEWLKTLPTVERSKLLGLPAEERIKRIKSLRQEQLRKTFGLWGSRQEPPGDVKRLFDWANSYVDNHRSEILDGLPPQDRLRLRHADPKRQQRILLFRTIGGVGRRPGQRMPMPSAEELEQLKKALSPQARELLENELNAMRRVALVQRWLQVSVMSRLLPPVDDEELRALEDSLSDAEREKLDQLSPNQRWMQLRRLYYMRNRPDRDARQRRMREQEAKRGTID